MGIFNETHIDDIEKLVGHEVGVSDWLTIDQERVNGFADTTNDHNPLHVDVEGAKDGPFGGTIAHGFLSLSLLSHFSYELELIPKGIAYGLNYGLDKVRFISPVRVGVRVRNRMELIGVEDKGGGRKVLKTRNTIEIEGADRPAMVAEWLGMYVKA